ncbi:MAG: CDP-alcohol phosphatidyltransferase family protein [Pannonibacter sp.]
MFDARLRPLIDPPLNAAGRTLAATGLAANAVTAIGLGFGLAAAALIALGYPLLALPLLLANRLADGLDGAIARATSRTDLGGYLDIVFDFLFYGAVPVAFALADPAANGVAAAVLLFSFYANGAAFLTFAIMAERRRLETSRQGLKSLYYLGGLAEGAETILVFTLMCVWPDSFAVLAYGFAVLCGLSAVARIATAIQVLKR